MCGSPSSLLRVILLVHLAASLGHSFIIEQPSSACFGDLPRWRHFVENVCYVSLLSGKPCSFFVRFAGGVNLYAYHMYESEASSMFQESHIPRCLSRRYSWGHMDRQVGSRHACGQIPRTLVC